MPRKPKRLSALRTIVGRSWDDADLKDLVRLANKYGSDDVDSHLRMLQPRLPGLTPLEDMHFAQFIEARREEFAAEQAAKDKGDHGGLDSALRLAHWLDHNDKPPTTKELDRLKKRYRHGMVLLRELQTAMQRGKSNR